MLGAGAMGQPRRMVWGGRREEGSGWGTHGYLWWIQNCFLSRFGSLSSRECGNRSTVELREVYGFIKFIEVFDYQKS